MPAGVWMVLIGLLGLFAGWGATDAWAQSADMRVYRYSLEWIDPSAERNPRGAEFPGFRGPDQMLVYTSAFGERTGTNDAGWEAVVRGGVVTQAGGNNQWIPSDGFVVSGHGTAAQWLRRFARPGAQAGVEEGKLWIRLTPQVYLLEVDAAIEQAQSRPPVRVAAYDTHLAQARHCRTALAQQAMALPLAELARQADTCKQAASRAFYQTVASRADEFRGAWIRPSSVNPERIREQVGSLKRLGIGHVFLETYFQGKTVYPSPLMHRYGLPEQHARYRGQDPVQLWLDAAQAEGIQVHLWVQVFFAGNAEENVEQYGPILNRYPQWRNVQRAFVDRAVPVPAQTEPGHYFVDPANAEVRTFLLDLLDEMIARYPAAHGVNLDYIRYPASLAPNRPTYLESTWGYTDTARAQFKALQIEEAKAAEEKRLETLKSQQKPLPRPRTQWPSVDPVSLKPGDSLWPRWVQWRKEVVSSFVREASARMRVQRPDLLVSAVVFPATDAAYVQKLQDYTRWAEEGSIQALLPIGLSPRPDWMLNQARQLNAQVQGRVPVYVGLFGLYNRQSPIDVVSQVDVVRQSGLPGMVFFDWSRLTPEYEEALLEGPFYAH